MQWIKSGIENPSKSEVIVRCGRDEQTERPRRNDKSRTVVIMYEYNTHTCLLIAQRYCCVVV